MPTPRELKRSREMRTSTKPWQTAEWRKQRAEFIKDKSCEWCGSRENLVVHHLSYRDKAGVGILDEDYIDFKKSENIRVLCKRCHYAQHKGLVLCKVCKKRYHPPNFKKCFTCNSNEYTHPWCNKKFLIQKRWWKPQTSHPSNVCWEVCRLPLKGEPDFCKEYDRNYDPDEDVVMDFGEGDKDDFI